MSVQNVSMAMPADSRCEKRFDVVFEVAGANSEKVPMKNF